MTDCLFCKIIAKEIPSSMVYEGSQAVGFKDINPKAKHHILVVPRKHIDSVMAMEEGDQELVGHLIWDAKKIAEDLQLEGYQLRFHVGAKGGQEIFHLHLHLLAD
ncbi:MAG: histidine triad nucleotide-binding protein [bacterium]|nr:histidine triad nucleotide-binding protein [bacterium]